MNQPANRQWKLIARPEGLPKRGDFSFETSPALVPADGQILVRNHYISLDPAMRGWMNDARSYVPPIKLGDIMRAGAVGEVVASRSPAFKEGDYAVGVFGMQDYAIAEAAGVQKIDPAIAPLPLFISALGMPGMTAYFGLLDIGNPQSGETVVVSAASGAVGALVGQIARIKGARAVGLAGGEAKCRYVTEELGFDACIDYKNEDIGKGLSRHCPKGIDIYFDNVGGEILDLCLARLARKARVIICGAISQYNNTGPVSGPKNYLSLLVNNARMEGFVVFNYASRYAEGMQHLAAWLREGKLKSREDIVEGLETFPETLLKLFSGENFGKLMIKAI
ncbi:MAG TPA: NADP-dependent oxidoreductase [Acetobacteraceae bacterium]|nr:NADP-dependent oxidoreductase [Acetobacteraceae bacterium]